MKQLFREPRRTLAALLLVYIGLLLVFTINNIMVHSHFGFAGEGTAGNVGLNLLSDFVAPVISNISVIISSTSATIQWNTNESANGSVAYGINTSLGSTISSATFSLSPSIDISGLLPSTLYFFNVTSCDTFGNCVTNGTFNFTTATQTQPEDNGHGVPPETPPEVVPPETPPEQPITPTPEVPGIIPETSIFPDLIPKGKVACIQTESMKSIPNGTVSEQTDFKYSGNMQEGYDILLSPFSVACNGTDTKLSVSLPDTYTDVKVMRCSGDLCSPLSVQEVTTLSCGDNVFTEIKRNTTFIEPEFFPVPVTKTAIGEGSTEIQSSGTKVSLSKGVAGSVSMDKASAKVPEAKNPRIRIVGTPTVLSFQNNPVDVDINVTLPYVVPDHIDELSVAGYALKNNQWSYLGGDVNEAGDYVSVEIKNVSQYLENNALTIAPMGLTCLQCAGTSFTKVYDGGSKDAVILVHGFENSPERFEDMVNDIRLTKQPWQVWTFGYSSDKEIKDSAKAFADFVESNNREFSHIYIIAHSMGGLVVQQALYDSYQANKNAVVKPYGYINDVDKVVLVGTPNKGALIQNLKGTFDAILNSDAAAALFNLNSKVIKELENGEDIPRVPGIDYRVVAGTQSYSFSSLFGSTEPNDGLVSLSSAQTVGGIEVKNYCQDFWSLQTTHTGLLNDFDSRRIIERIVSSQVNVGDRAAMGHSYYYEINIPLCSANDKYIIIGKRVEPKAAPSPGLCNCGNGVCGTDENSDTCPSDCAVFEKPQEGLLFFLLHFAPLRNGIIALVLLLILFLAFVKKGKELTLLELILETHTAIREGKRGKIISNYKQFAKKYNESPEHIRKNYQDAAVNLKKEVEKKFL